MKIYRSIQSTVQPPVRLPFNKWALYIKKQIIKTQGQKLSGQGVRSLHDGIKDKID